MKLTLFSLLALSSTAVFANTNFEKLYKQASTPSASKTIIIADDFENGISQALKDIIHCEDSSSSAGLFISSESKAAGAQSAKLTKSPTVKHGFMPAISQWFRGEKALKDGTLKLSFAFMIPESTKAVVNIEARDYTVKPSVSHFKSVITAQGFRIGTESKGYPKGQWHHCEMIVPLNQADKDITMTIIQSDGQTKQTAVQSNSSNKLSWIGVMLISPKDAHMFIDNFVISHEKSKMKI